MGFVALDLDGTKKSDLRGCWWPDGAWVTSQALQGAWDPEVGGEEELAFPLAMARMEAEDVMRDNRKLDYAVRSHMLLVVMHAVLRKRRP